MMPLAKSQTAQLHPRVVSMLDQQFWRWGCDVKHAAGNLLVKYGYQRIPPPALESKSSSAYRLELSSQVRVIVRSFVVFCGDDDLGGDSGGLLLKRFDCRPYRTPMADLLVLPYAESDLPALECANQGECQWQELAKSLFTQIAEYEAWVMREFGSSYIENSLAGRGKQPVVTADKVVAEWSKLASQIGNSHGH